jgi:hypothetical protein
MLVVISFPLMMAELVGKEVGDTGGAVGVIVGVGVDVGTGVSPGWTVAVGAGVSVSMGE